MALKPRSTSREDSTVRLEDVGGAKSQGHPSQQHQQTAHVDRSKVFVVAECIGAQRNEAARVLPDQIDLREWQTLAAMFSGVAERESRPRGSPLRWRGLFFEAPRLFARCAKTPLTAPQGGVRRNLSN